MKTLSPVVTAVGGVEDGALSALAGLKRRAIRSR